MRLLASRADISNQYIHSILPPALAQRCQTSLVTTAAATLLRARASLSILRGQKHLAGFHPNHPSVLPVSRAHHYNICTSQHIKTQLIEVVLFNRPAPSQILGYGLNLLFLLRTADTRTHRRRNLPPPLIHHLPTVDALQNSLHSLSTTICSLLRQHDHTRSNRRLHYCTYVTGPVEGRVTPERSRKPG